MDSFAEVKDPTQKQLRLDKKNWNKQFGEFVSDLANFKRLMVGSPSKFNAQKGKITEPILSDPSKILSVLTGRFQQLSNESLELSNRQLEYSRIYNQNKINKKGSLNLNEEILSSEASNRLTRFFNAFKGPYFGEGGRKRSHRRSLLAGFVKIEKSLKELESQILESSDHEDETKSGIFKSNALLNSAMSSLASLKELYKNYDTFFNEPQALTDGKPTATTKNNSIRTYKFRSDAADDIDAFFKALKKENYSNVNVKTKSNKKIPSLEVEFNSGKDLSYLKQLADSIPNCHVISETMAEEVDYNGIRVAPAAQGTAPPPPAASPGTAPSAGAQTSARVIRDNVLYGDPKNEIIPDNITPKITEAEVVKQLLVKQHPELEASIKQLYEARKAHRADKLIGPLQTAYNNFIKAVQISGGFTETNLEDIRSNLIQVKVNYQNIKNLEKFASNMVKKWFLKKKLQILGGDQTVASRIDVYDASVACRKEVNALMDKLEAGINKQEIEAGISLVENALFKIKALMGPLVFLMSGMEDPDNVISMLENGSLLGHKVRLDDGDRRLITSYVKRRKITDLLQLFKSYMYGVK